MKLINIIIIILVCLSLAAIAQIEPVKEAISTTYSKIIFSVDTKPILESTKIILDTKDQKITEETSCFIENEERVFDAKGNLLPKMIQIEMKGKEIREAFKVAEQSQNTAIVSQTLLKTITLKEGRIEYWEVKKCKVETKVELKAIPIEEII